MNLPSNITLNEELVFKNIEEQSFENIETKNITIKNSIIRNCKFINVNLGHCDLLSSKIYGVFFKNVSLTCADIFSIWFSECEFDNVDFTGAGIEDITFFNCHFNHCTFEDVGLKNCTFSNTSFVEIAPISSSFILNQYNNCTFEICKFAGSFQYQIFENCEYKDVDIDCSLLKYNFGIGMKKGVCYLKNNIQVEDLTYLYKMLMEECSKQKLFLNAAFVNFNFEHFINPQLILKSIDAIEIMLSNEILIRNDELLFLKKIYQYMYEHKMIAPILLYQLLNKMREFDIALDSNIAYTKSREALSLIYNDLYSNFYKFCDSLQETLENIPHLRGILKLHIDYEYEPYISLSDLLNQCLPGTFVRISSRKGSFHELIEMLPQGLDILNIFLQLLGISIPIIYAEIKEKKEQEKKKTKIKKSVNLNIVNQNKIKDSTKTIHQTCKTIVSSGILNENLQGYNNSNIKEIKIQYNINIQV